MSNLPEKKESNLHVIHAGIKDDLAQYLLDLACAVEAGDLDIRKAIILFHHERKGGTLRHAADFGIDYYQQVGMLHLALSDIMAEWRTPS